jgi:hypothetical protein
MLNKRKKERTCNTGCIMASKPAGSIELNKKSVWPVLAGGVLGTSQFVTNDPMGAPLL